MTLKEYFTKSISNLINLINSNNDVKKLITIMISLWIILIISSFVMLCKGYRTTFGTPLMWLILNLFFGPFLTVPFIIGAFGPGKKIINPIHMKLNFFLPLVISLLISKCRILHESNIIAIFLSSMISAIITLVLVVMCIYKGKKNIYITADSLSGNKVQLFSKYMYNRKERFKMRHAKNTYTFTAYNFTTHKFDEKSVDVLSSDYISKCYMISYVKEGNFKRVLYQKPDKDTIKIVQLDYPIESYFYSYLAGIFIMLWFNIPFLEAIYIWIQNF